MSIKELNLTFKLLLFTDFVFYFIFAFYFFSYICIYGLYVNMKASHIMYIIYAQEA